MYDKSWLAGGYPKQSCWGCRFGVDVIARLPFHSVLDAGTGNGGLVRLMREHGECVCVAQRLWQLLWWQPSDASHQRTSKSHHYVQGKAPGALSCQRLC